MPSLSVERQRALERAAHWFSVLGSEHACSEDHSAWTAWLHAAPDNRWAWEQVQSLQQRLHALPGPVSQRALSLAEHSVHSSRRTMLKGVALALGVGVLGAGGYRQAHRDGWLADYHTGTGEQLKVVLADGSQLQLNTASAVDVRYSAGERQLLLRRGEILVSTAVDSARRPFFVDTAQGRVQALGTRFSLRSLGDSCEVAVYEHQVRITARQAEPVLLDAGSACRFDATHSSAPEPLRAGQAAWADGILLANDQRLDTFLAELARYRSGWLRCDPAVAGLRISGAFPINDTDQALRAVTSALPVRVQSTTRYWVSVVPG